MPDDYDKPQLKFDSEQKSEHKQPSWRLRVFLGSLIGLAIGLSAQPTYSSLDGPGSEIALRNALTYGGTGMLIGAAIGATLFVVRRIQDSRS